MPSPTSVAFICVQNAGRSQMATTFAERERDERDERELDVEILTGGTRPADRVHPEVVETMVDAGFDLGDREPREISFDEIQRADYVITMGCSTDDVCPAGWTGESRDWNLDDPDGRPPEKVAAVRDEIADRVAALFDELERR